MVIIKLQGGLGNQMFQYAFGYTIAKKYNRTLKLDVSGFKRNGLRQYQLQSYPIKHETASKKEILALRYEQEPLIKCITRRFTKTKRKDSPNYYREKKNEPFVFNDSYPKSDNIYFEGFWQNERYFYTSKDCLSKIFEPEASADESFNFYKNKITNSASVSLHIRRGDYAQNTSALEKHGLCDLNYYTAAINKIVHEVPNPVFFIFSDDITWTKKNMPDLQHAFYIENIRDRTDALEMQLMKLCQHNIIANSTFSWWSAWLNQNPNKKVIAPRTWCLSTEFDSSDIVPRNWTRL